MISYIENAKGVIKSSVRSEAVQRNLYTKITSSYANKIELLDLEMKKIQLTIASKTGVNSAGIF